MEKTRIKKLIIAFSISSEEGEMQSGFKKFSVGIASILSNELTKCGFTNSIKLYDKMYYRSVNEFFIVPIKNKLSPSQVMFFHYH